MDSSGKVRRTSVGTWLATIVILGLVLGGLYFWRTSRVAGPPRGISRPVAVTSMVVKPADAPVYL